MLFFFFFQAEDGIRDKLVTGVQTCALPILARPARVDRLGAAPRARELPARPALVPRGSRGRRRLARVRAPREWSRVRRPLGVLELLGSDEVDLHGAVPTRHEALRDARARVPRLPAVRPRVLRDVPRAPRPLGGARADAGAVNRPKGSRGRGPPARRVAATAATTRTRRSC